jgi:hypothetical protein
MTSSEKPELLQRWIFPLHPEDLAPLPALSQFSPEYDREDIDFIFDRHRKRFCSIDEVLAREPYFEVFSLSNIQIYDSFGECQKQMLAYILTAMGKLNHELRELAAKHEHVLSLNPTPFPLYTADLLNPSELRNQAGQETGGNAQETQDKPEAKEESGPKDREKSHARLKEPPRRKS